jgi:hypothetical protein
LHLQRELRPKKGAKDTSKDSTGKANCKSTVPVFFEMKRFKRKTFPNRREVEKMKKKPKPVGISILYQD